MTYADESPRTGVASKSVPMTPALNSRNADSSAIWLLVRMAEYRSPMPVLAFHFSCENQHDLAIFQNLSCRLSPPFCMKFSYRPGQGGAFLAAGLSPTARGPAPAALARAPACLSSVDFSAGR